MRTFVKSLLLFALSFVLSSSSAQQCDSRKRIIPSNKCVTFSVTQGTGCSWMCSYCAQQLGTNNYYFTDNVCTYSQGLGCVGNPYAGVSYTCCSL